MIVKIRIGRWRLVATISPVIDVKGVNSQLPDGNHILMWDFDNVSLPYVRNALETTQRTYQLPNIYILETKPPNIQFGKFTKVGDGSSYAEVKGLGNYIAYCFKRLKWRKTVEIILYTKHVCWNFIKWGVFRKRFTLRVTPKEGRTPKHVLTLHSKTPEDVTILQLKSWVQYETLSDQYKPRMIKLGTNK